jgi:hypothetical protein
VLRIGASVAVSNQPIVAELILIGSRFAFDDWDRRKTQRYVEQCGFEDTLRSDERDASAFEVKAPCENRPR